MFGRRDPHRHRLKAVADERQLLGRPATLAHVCGREHAVHLWGSEKNSLCSELVPEHARAMALTGGRHFGGNASGHAEPGCDAALSSGPTRPQNGASSWNGTSA
jgi:hypothetical protein